MLKEKLERIFNDQIGNYVFPFFWQGGEEEQILREYMQVIHDANMRAVCIESRSHPDFAGPKWWRDMDIILEEARRLQMKVWILDDSHFPTGFANGTLKEQPDTMRRQGIICRKYQCREGEQLVLDETVLGAARHTEPSQMELALEQLMNHPIERREFQDDRMLGVIARREEKPYTEIVLAGSEIYSLTWNVPEGNWKVYVLQLSRNLGFHRDYINMLQKESCRLLIDSVYQPHWEHYREEFGTTIAGFFSDEPELGNGHIYDADMMLGTADDLPWSAELEQALRAEWGDRYLQFLSCLWDNEAPPEEKAYARYTYMDQVTRLVQKNFSEQIGGWCREHHVEYIGHLIEDNDQHARTGSGLGHYFRGLAGQGMAGIDDIGGQVFPQGEDAAECGRDGEFYHFMLGRLAGSAAAVEPLKKGRAMCEIFGNYGWAEGVKLEKYLLDHFLVRGVNHFVPHAFSAKEFPDPDCPPHFYAHGNNPQYRHFGELMKYANRMCELLNDGKHKAPVAVIYHAEGEWTGRTLYSHKIGRILAEAQIEYDYLPLDVFAEKKNYRTRYEEGALSVNEQKYKAVIVPGMEYITGEFALAAREMQAKNIPVIFEETAPSGICSIQPRREDKEQNGLWETTGLQKNVLKTEEIVEYLNHKKIGSVSFSPADIGLRYYEYTYPDGNTLLMVVNEGTEMYQGRLLCDLDGTCYEYEPWDNKMIPADVQAEGIRITVYPYQSKLLIFDRNESCAGYAEAADSAYMAKAEFLRRKGMFQEVEMPGAWTRSICTGKEYPHFRNPKETDLPDHLWEEQPDFSGYARYEKEIDLEDTAGLVLCIEDAAEGVEVFVNGKSLGIQCVPPYVYLPGRYLSEGKNKIVIEVASTLERAMAKVPDIMGQTHEAVGKTGITGKAGMYRKISRQ